MKEFMVFALLMLTVHVKANIVKCEWTEYYDYFHGEDPASNTCYMHTVTTINSPGFILLSKTKNIERLVMHGNKKIRFLPEKVAESFPDLLHYLAQRCAITEISIVNFENLTKLRNLNLRENQIEKIADNTFNDLKSLTHLWLSKKFSFL